MSVESPSPRPAVAPANDLLPFQHSFSPMIAAHSSPMPRTGSPLGLGTLPYVPIPLYQPSTIDQPHARSPVGSDIPNGEPDSPTCQTPEVDPQILEALRSKDRLYVLKLGEAMESLIIERRSRMDLSPSTSYQRLLVHRCSAYYKLSPESDHASKGIIVLLTPDSKIPTRRLCELVPAETAAQPAIKIMRRSAQDRFRNKSYSQAGSVAGEEADLSDVEPSESGSIGSRSNATGGSGKKRMTIEEREAAYNEARSRIFMGFDEKEKGKDMNASSSSLSLASGSVSTNGGNGSSGLDDFDDSVGSPTTESEWSGSVARETKDGRRGMGSTSATSSSRSLRSTAPPFNANGSSSSRGSRANSPSPFTYASLYEPPSSSPYDGSQMTGQAPGAGYTAQFMYPYLPPGQSPHPPYIAPYPLYVPYPFQQSVLPNPEHPPPPAGNLFNPTHNVGYDNFYGWPHPQQPALQMQQQPPSQSQQTPNHPGPPLPQNSTPYQPTYMAPVSFAPYPIPGYYQPHPEQHIRHPLPHMTGQPMFSGETPRNVNGNGLNGNRNVLTNGSATGNSSRASSRNSTGSGKRGVQPPSRSGWSYPPGIGGFSYNGAGAGPGMSPMNSGDAVVGPRLSASMRRGSGTSVGSTGNKTSTGDEASSTASSSTTSSSSRRTYTSTASSQHPLPPRPDWAVGLKPHPTLHTPHPRHHGSPGSDWSAGLKSQSTLPSPHSLNNPLNLSPGRNGDTSMSPYPQMSPVLLQSTDFPPLTSVTSPPEKRTPAVAGVWTNSSSTRSILINNPPGNVLVHHSNAPNNTLRIDEQDRGFERPPPKGSVELYNPKIVRRPNNIGKSGSQQGLDRDKEMARGEAVASAILLGQVVSLSLDEPSTDPKDSSMVVMPT